jgi:hypothetical protein
LARDHWYQLKGWVNDRHYLSRIVRVKLYDKSVEATLEKKAQQFMGDYPLLIKKVTWEMYWQAGQKQDGPLVKQADTPDSKSGA